MRELRRNLFWLALVLVLLAVGVIVPRLMIVAEIAGRELFLLRWLLLPAVLILGAVYVTRPKPRD